MNIKIYELIEKYAKILSALPGYSRKGWKILVNIDGKLFETEDGCSFAELSEGDIREINRDDCENGQSGVQDYGIERKLLLENDEINGIVLSKTPFCTLAADRSMTLTAALDDMAQIIGPRAETAAYDENSVRSALQTAAACLIAGKYTITTGRSLFEAVTALEVLEKSAEINIKAEVLGGPVPLGRIEAEEMRRIYKEQYSKSEAAVKAREGSQRGAGTENQKPFACIR